ncbi:Uncharacterised protein [Campylobacter jejuni subsp. doylei]|uniref:Uncharacterized protein n=1 Tax=Campylobacter jejuni subsp. doylei TaxID=32021 RepID=A0A448J5N3_CAMJU|nr:hypothetical protein [Campylobacter jejuni]VEG59965.1 Uncharacterised protein [Campylobacter jejuni subsp. doylei]
MNLEVDVDVSDLDYVDVNDVLYLFNDRLNEAEQEDFLRRLNEDININPLQRIKIILQSLPNYEALNILKELNNEFKSDKEWQEIAKSINGDER